MRGKRRIIVLVMIMFVFLTGCSWRRYTVSGHVTDINGKGVDGVSINITYGEKQSVISIQTDSSGAWNAVLPKTFITDVTLVKSGWVFTLPTLEYVFKNVENQDFIGVLDGPIQFADANLEDAVRFSIGKASGDIRVSDVIKVTTFDAGSRDIVSLEGIQYFLSANQVDLDHNKISDITPLVKLKQSLLQLRIDSNPVQNLEKLAELNLTSLKLGDNGTNDFNFIKDVVSLTELTIHSSQLSDLSFLLPLKDKLTLLDLTQNLISDISILSNFKQLWDLILTKNQIKNISALSELTNLSALLLEDNQIQDIDALTNLTNLRMLIIDRNQIENINPLSNLINLDYLSMYHNNVENLNALGNLTRISTLQMAGNLFSDISVLLNISQLQLLILGENPNLDLSKDSPASKVLEKLKERNVEILYVGS